MYYSTHYKTKWHDTDGDGVMRPSALLVYMQETANVQCREYGMDLTDLHHKEGKGFLLSRIMVKIFAPLRAYEDMAKIAAVLGNRSLDYIFLTHSHYDHFDLATIEKIAGEKCAILCDKTSAAAFEHDCTTMLPGSVAEPFEGLSVRAVPAYNILAYCSCFKVFINKVCRFHRFTVERTDIIRSFS